MIKYPVAKPYITAADEKAVLRVLRSGVLSLGPAQDEFERRFAKKVGTKYACAVSNGTAGLHLALLAAGIKRGDEVITSPLSFVASANAILYVGAKPVFADIDPLTYNLDPREVAKKITRKTKTILVVHIFGQPADMALLMRLAKRHNLKIIEDACESLGATYHGRRVGTFGESAVFAFYPNKQMTTGEGGMIATNDRKILGLCRSLRNQGRAENRQWLDHTRLGYNYRLGEMAAALGLSQLDKLDFMISQRRKIAGWYAKHLRRHRAIIRPPVIRPGNTHTWFVYVVRVAKKGVDRNKIIEVLSKKGISTKPYLPSIHLFDFYRRRFGYRPGDFPRAEEVSREALALPIYVGLKEKDVKIIAANLVEIVRNYDRYL